MMKFQPSSNLPPPEIDALLKEGKITSSITKTESYNATTPLSPIIYPNPSSGVFNVERKGTSGSLYIDVLNIEGKIVKQIALIANNNQIDLSDLENGMYLLKISNEDLISNQSVVISK